MNAAENLKRAVRFEKPEWIPMVFHINPSCWNHYPHDALQELMAAHPLLFPGSWPPFACPLYDDVDQSDDVLFFLEFAAWSSNHVGNPPINIGLVGANRVIIVPGFVATLTPEDLFEHDRRDVVDDVQPLFCGEEAW